MKIEERGYIDQDGGKVAVVQRKSPSGGSSFRWSICRVTLDDQILEEQQKQPVNITEKVVGYATGDFQYVRYSRQPTYDGYFIFRGKIFFVSLPLISSAAAKQEAILHVKRRTYLEDKKLQRLRNEIAAFERVVEGTERNKRGQIPDLVRLVVYERDQGKCVKCGATKDLQFDHMIPVAKGGSSAEANIQLLCERCNLEKSDNLA